MARTDLKSPRRLYTASILFYPPQFVPSFFFISNFFTKIYLYQFIKIVDPDRLNFSRYWLHKRIQYVAIANISVLIDDVPVLDGHVGLFSSFSFFFLNSFFCSPIHSLLMKVWCRASYSDNESTNNDNDDIIFFSSSVLSLTFPKYSFFFSCVQQYLSLSVRLHSHTNTHTLMKSNKFMFHWGSLTAPTVTTSWNWTRKPLCTTPDWWRGSHRPPTSRPVTLTLNISRWTYRRVSSNSDPGPMQVTRSAFTSTQCRQSILPILNLEFNLPLFFKSSLWFWVECRLFGSTVATTALKMIDSCWS